jgi:hypothetical protein
MQLMKEHPGILFQEIASALGVDRSTVTRDMQELTRQMEVQTREDFSMHQKRLLEDIQIKKGMCMDKLNLCVSPTSGARWMEEYTKLLNLECKILSMFNPDKVLPKESKEKLKIGKRERDAAVQAVMDEGLIPMKSANPTRSSAPARAPARKIPEQA